MHPHSKNGSIRVRSSTKGRVRFEIAALRRNPLLALTLEHRLADHAAVSEAHGNPITGSLLVRFQPTTSCEEMQRLVETALLEQPGLGTLPVLTSNGKASACGHDHAHGHGCDHAHDEVDAKLVRNLWIGGGVLAAVGIKRLIFGAGALASSPLLFALSAGAAIVSGYPFIKGAFNTFTGRSGITTDTLVGSATLASLAARENFTALTVIFLLNVGEYLQALTLGRTRQAIRDLLDIGDEEAWVVLDSGEVRRPIGEVRVGDLIAVYSGTKLPADGMVETGSATINEAPITGESLPARRNPGDRVFAGTILLAGEIRIRVDKVGDDTAVGRLIRRVEEAQAARAPIQTIGERFSNTFVPASFALSGVVLLLTGNVNRALTMLLIACPCAAGLATPTAVSAAIGNAARRGILIKGGAHLEAAAELDVVVFDKTGTLTIGLPGVERVIALDDDYPPDRVLALAATGELHSQHPLALAVVRHATERDVVIPHHDKCEVIVGRGMHAFGENGRENRVLVGNVGLLEQFGVPLSDEARAWHDKYARSGETMMYVAHQDKVIGLLGVRDRVRPEAAAALLELRRMGIQRLLMLTGDGAEAAASVAQLVGLSSWRARLMPDEKYEVIRRLQAQNLTVAMVGDGINDAPALALADVGVAMGTDGSDVAIESADIALASNDLRRLATTVRLSQRTVSLIRQNYAMALGVNAVGLGVGALGALNPLLAAFLHNLSTLLVVLNSARLINYDADRKNHNRQSQ